MKTLIMYFKIFKTENKRMFRLGLFSWLFSLSYLVTEIFPCVFVELFVGADKIYNYLYDISLAIFASVIFYFIQSFIPEVIDKKFYFKLIKIDVKDIYFNCNKLVSILSVATKSSINEILCIENKCCEIDDKESKNNIKAQIDKIKKGIDDYEKKPFSTKDAEVLIKLKEIKNCDFIYILEYMMEDKLKGKNNVFKNTNSLEHFINLKDDLNELISKTK